MKKLIALTLIITVVLSLSCACAEVPYPIDDFQHCGGMYPRGAVITALDYETDTVTVNDGAGFEWQFEGCEDWSVGDLVSMMMYDNGTPKSIFDDVIVLAFWSGWSL